MSPNVHVQMQWPPVGIEAVGWDKRALVMSAVLAGSYYSANVAMVAKDSKVRDDATRCAAAPRWAASPCMHAWQPPASPSIIHLRMCCLPRPFPWYLAPHVCCVCRQTFHLHPPTRCLLYSL